MDKKINKNFDTWNGVKKLIDQTPNLKTFKEREVWFVKIGQNVGFEQSGKGDEFLRPVIVYKKFSKDAFFGIPLTKTMKVSQFYRSFNFKGQQSNAILSQARLFDAKRLKYTVGRMSVGDYGRIKEKLIALLQ